MLLTAFAFVSIIGNLSLFMAWAGDPWHIARSVAGSSILYPAAKHKKRKPMFFLFPEQRRLLSKETNTQQIRDDAAPLAGKAMLVLQTDLLK